MARFKSEMSPRERLVYHVQELERLEELKRLAAARRISGSCARQSMAAYEGWQTGDDIAGPMIALRAHLASLAEKGGAK